jgi:hypothetical protein
MDQFAEPLGLLRVRLDNKDRGAHGGASLREKRVGDNRDQSFAYPGQNRMMAR